MYVDLPPILGPVTTSMRRWQENDRSLGTKGMSETVRRPDVGLPQCLCQVYQAESVVINSMFQRVRQS